MSTALLEFAESCENAAIQLQEGLAEKISGLDLEKGEDLNNVDLMNSTIASVSAMFAAFAKAVVTDTQLREENDKLKAAVRELQR